MSEQTPRFQSEPTSAGLSRGGAIVAFGLVRFALVVFVFVVTFVFAGVFGVSVYESYFKIPEEVEVPAITGKDLNDANALLEKVGLHLAIRESRHNNKVAERAVISQDPAAGRKVRRNREILAVISMGPELVDVPDLKGKSLREARMVLSNSRLRLGKITYKDEKPGEPEQILEQKPAGGEKVGKGKAIDLQVQKGSGSATTDVPSWAGQHVYRIEELIARSHLELASVNWVLSDFVPKGEVVSQSPNKGQKVAFNSQVELEVSAGPKSQSRLFRQRKLMIQVPQGSRSQRVSVVLNSEIGADKIFEGSPVGGEKMELLVAGWTGSEVEVYVNDRLQRREKL
jgi:beta-lactam-binding protein with PASTA domain